MRHLGGLGLFLLAIVDSSPIPTFGGLDILTAILAARQREPWYYYAGVATAGSVIGAYLTFRMARKAGLDYLSRKFGKRKVAKLLKYFERWGTGALVVSTVLPLPFPTSAFFAVSRGAGLPSPDIHHCRGFEPSSALRSHSRNCLPLRPPLRCRSAASRATFRVVAGDCRRGGHRGDRGDGAKKATTIESPRGQDPCPVICPLF